MIMEIRKNKVKQKLMKGEIATVPISPFAITPDIIEYFGSYGFDGIQIENEHGAIDFADIPAMTMAADLWGMTSIVRVNLNLEGVIFRTLDVGASGIMVPHVDTKEDAEKVVKASKFHPVGTRGMYTSRQGIGVSDYFAKANDETLLVVLIEDVTAVENLNSILEVDNIDVFHVPPGDLAQSMGLLGQTEHPEVLKKIDEAILKIVGAGRVAGVSAKASNVESYIDKGVTFLTTTFGSWIENGAKDFLERCNKY